MTWLATLLATGNMSSQTRCARLEEEQSGRITSTLPPRRIQRLARRSNLENLKELVEFLSRVLDRKKEKNWDGDAKSLYSRAAISSCSIK